MLETTLATQARPTSVLCSNTNVSRMAAILSPTKFTRHAQGKKLELNITEFQRIKVSKPALNTQYDLF